MIIQVQQARMVLEAAESELADAKERVRELEAVVRFARRRMDENSSPTLPLTSAWVEDAAQNYGAMSLPDGMRDVLAKAGHPLHVREIARRLVEGGKPDSDNLPISVTSAGRRRSDWFVQTAKATFSLKNGVAHEKRPADSSAGL